MLWTLWTEKQHICGCFVNWRCSSSTLEDPDRSWSTMVIICPSQFPKYADVKYVYVYIYIRMYIYIYVCVYVYMCIYICTCMYILHIQVIPFIPGGTTRQRLTDLDQWTQCCCPAASWWYPWGPRPQSRRCGTATGEVAGFVGWPFQERRGWAINDWNKCYAYIYIWICVYIYSIYRRIDVSCQFYIRLN